MRLPLNDLAQVPRHHGRSRLRVSLNQERYLVATECAARLGPGAAAVTGAVTMQLKMEGPLDECALRSALKAIVARHEGLRARFMPSPELSTSELDARLSAFFLSRTVTPGTFVQYVDESVHDPLLVEDLSLVPSVERSARVARVIDREISQPFDDATAPRARFVLMRLSDVEHRLVIVVDHLVFDGQSAATFLSELRALYGAAVSGTPAELPELPFHYTDFGHWQSENADSGVFDDECAYWEHRWREFGDAQFSEGQFGDAPIRRHVGQAAGREQVLLNTELVKGIRAAARGAGATLFVFFLAALGRAAETRFGMRKLGVWTPFANRQDPRSHPVAGWFTNCHLLGVSVGQASAARLLMNVRQEVSDAFACQSMPLAVLWRRYQHVARPGELRVRFDVTRRTAPFTVHPAAAGLSAARLPTGDHPRSPDLRIAVTDDAEGISLGATFARRRCQPNAIRELLADIVRAAAWLAECRPQ